MKVIYFIVAIIVINCCPVAQAQQCFFASGKAMYDAQQIRKMALSINWEVGKAQSVAAGSFIKGKMSLYPQDELEVCIRETDKEGNKQVQFKAQSQALDAGEAIWRNLHGKQLKSTTVFQ